MGSILGTVKDAVDEMRAAGEKVGLVKIRCFRPFPTRRSGRRSRAYQALQCLTRTSPWAPRERSPLEVRDALYGITDTDPWLHHRPRRTGCPKKDIADDQYVARRAGKGDQFYGLRTEVI